MTAPDHWLTAFPVKPAAAAIEALQEAWSELARVPRPHFNPKTNEPDLTKTLKVYVERDVAPKRGLLGMWAAEDIIGDVDPATGARIEERRTDIVYGWNNENTGMQLVFEFKRLGRQKSHRDHYLRDRGLGRFVTGIYSRRQAVAAMVGVLLDPEAEVVPAIRSALGSTALATLLRLRPAASGLPYARPSTLFASADFDTDHERDARLAPTHGYIRVSHFFFAFGYPTSTRRPARLRLPTPYPSVA